VSRTVKEARGANLRLESDPKLSGMPPVNWLLDRSRCWRTTSCAISELDQEGTAPARELLRSETLSTDGGDEAEHAMPYHSQQEGTESLTPPL
jgi:hypothetical protein